MYEGKLKMELELSSHPPSSSLHVVEEAGDIFLFSCFFPFSCFFFMIFILPHITVLSPSDLFSLRRQFTPELLMWDSDYLNTATSYIFNNVLFTNLFSPRFSNNLLTVLSQFRSLGRDAMRM